MRSVNGHGGDLVVRGSPSCQVTAENCRAPRRVSIGRYNRWMICAALPSVRTRFAASPAVCASLVALLLTADLAWAGLPRPVARAFAEQHIPLTSVTAFVQELGDVQPLFTQDPAKPMNPASTMKLVTTFAGLELLGSG